MEILRQITVFDAADPDTESRFWAAMLGGEVRSSDDWYAVVVDGEYRLAVQPVAGHVPGAHSLPATDNLDPTGLLRPPDELRALYAEALDADRDGRPVAVSCGSGVTAALDALVLHGLGVEVALYEGSWSGWVADPSRPVATGT